MCTNKNCNCNGNCKCHNQIILKEMNNATKDSILQTMYDLPDYVYLTVSVNTRQYDVLLCNVLIKEDGQLDFCIINKPTGFYIRTQKGVRGEKFTSLGGLISNLRRALNQDSRVINYDKITLVSRITDNKLEVVSK